MIMIFWDENTIENMVCQEDNEHYILCVLKNKMAVYRFRVVRSTVNTPAIHKGEGSGRNTVGAAL